MAGPLNSTSFLLYLSRSALCLGVECAGSDCVCSFWFVWNDWKKNWVFSSSAHHGLTDKEKKTNSSSKDRRNKKTENMTWLTDDGKLYSSVSPPLPFLQKSPVCVKYCVGGGVATILWTRPESGREGERWKMETKGSFKSGKEKRSVCLVIDFNLAKLYCMPQWIPNFHEVCLL